MTRSLFAAVADRMSRLRRPRVLLLVVIALLYGPSLAAPFFVDDYRDLRLMEQYARGERPRLGLYEFIRDPADNAAMRARGELLWWVADGMYYAYLRPVTERVLYAQYLAFGRNPLGYRLVSLGMYFTGLCLALSLFRRWGMREEAARWATLLFAVASSNTLPVIFIASQCDLLALIGVLAALLAASRYTGGGSIAWFFAAISAYGASLFCKEAAVPAAVLPVLSVLSRRAVRAKNPLPDPGAPELLVNTGHGSNTRTIAITLAWIAMAGAFIAYHGRHRFGSTSLMMLDPLHSTAAYLAELPLRTINFLGSWITAINPVLVYTGGDPNGPRVFGAVATLFLAPLAIWIIRRRSNRLLLAFALWPLVFMPVLCCTLPDSRVMMLPTVGLCGVGAVWLLRPEGGLRRLPALLLIAAPLLTGAVTQIINVTLEKNAAENLMACVRGFERPARRDDCIFIFNTHWSLDTLWGHDRLLHLLGRDAPYVTYLSPLMEVRPEVLGPRTLRLHAMPNDAGVLTSFFDAPASLGVLTRRAPPENWTSRMAEFTARVGSLENGKVMQVDLEFRDPLDSPRYGFFFLVPNKTPQRWRPGPPSTSPAAQKPSSALSNG